MTTRDGVLVHMDSVTVPFQFFDEFADVGLRNYFIEKH